MVGSGRKNVRHQTIRGDRLLMAPSHSCGVTQSEVLTCFWCEDSVEHVDETGLCDCCAEDARLNDEHVKELRSDYYASR